MKLRIKTIARSKGITLKQIAEQLGISNVNLSNSLNNNPTINRLQEVADVLDVPLACLFEPYPQKPILNGYIELDGVIHKINSLDDLRNITQEADNFYASFGIESYK